MKVRRSPLRSCIGCRAIRPKRELVRLVRTPEDALVLDWTGKLPGRGAYLCPEPDCLRTALKRNSLDRAFRRPITVAERDALTGAIADYFRKCEATMPVRPEAQ